VPVDEEVKATAQVLIDAGKALSKPIVVVADAGQTPEAALLAFKAQELLAQAGLPVFPKIQAAVTAIGKFAKYQEFVRRGLWAPFSW
jgi:acyl-CoA synthetase (NDP forming)